MHQVMQPRLSTIFFCRRGGGGGFGAAPVPHPQGQLLVLVPDTQITVLDANHTLWFL